MLNPLWKKAMPIISLSARMNQTLRVCNLPLAVNPATVLSNLISPVDMV